MLNISPTDPNYFGKLINSLTLAEAIAFCELSPEKINVSQKKEKQYSTLAPPITVLSDGVEGSVPTRVESKKDLEAATNTSVSEFKKNSKEAINESLTNIDSSETQPTVSAASSPILTESNKLNAIPASSDSVDTSLPTLADSSRDATINQLPMSSETPVSSDSVDTSLPTLADSSRDATINQLPMSSETPVSADSLGDSFLPASKIDTDTAIEVVNTEESKTTINESLPTVNLSNTPTTALADSSATASSSPVLTESQNPDEIAAAKKHQKKQRKQLRKSLLHLLEYPLKREQLSKKLIEEQRKVAAKLADTFTTGQWPKSNPETPTESPQYLKDNAHEAKYVCDDDKKKNNALAVKKTSSSVQTTGLKHSSWLRTGIYRNGNVAKDKWKVDKYAAMRPEEGEPRRRMEREIRPATAFKYLGIFTGIRLFLLRLDHALSGTLQIVSFTAKFTRRLFPFAWLGFSYGLELFIDLCILIKASIEAVKSRDKSVLVDTFWKDDRPARMMNAAIWLGINIATYVLTGGVAIIVMNLAGFAFDVINEYYRAREELRKYESLLKKVNLHLKKLEEKLCTDKSKLHHLEEKSLRAKGVHDEGEVKKAALSENAQILPEEKRTLDPEKDKKMIEQNILQLTYTKNTLISHIEKVEHQRIWRVNWTMVILMGMILALAIFPIFNLPFIGVLGVGLVFAAGSVLLGLGKRLFDYTRKLIQDSIKENNKIESIKTFVKNIKTRLQDSVRQGKNMGRQILQKLRIMPKGAVTLPSMTNVSQKFPTVAASTVCDSFTTECLSQSSMTTTPNSNRSPSFAQLSRISESSASFEDDKEDFGGRSPKEPDSPLPDVNTESESIPRSEETGCSSSPQQTNELKQEEIVKLREELKHDENKDSQRGRDKVEYGVSSESAVQVKAILLSNAVPLSSKSFLFSDPCREVSEKVKMKHTTNEGNDSPQVSEAFVPPLLA